MGTSSYRIPQYLGWVRWVLPEDLFEGSEKWWESWTTVCQTTSTFMSKSAWMRGPEVSNGVTGIPDLDLGGTPPPVGGIFT